MTIISILAAIVCFAVVLVPGLGELLRRHHERNNPIRRLRIQTRRQQLPSASGSFVGSR